MEQIVRGRITAPSAYDSAQARKRPVTKYFMFNPNEIEDDKGVNFGSLEVPGASHPVYQFGSGKERVIQFQLYLDGDRGRVGRTHVNIEDLATLSIKKEIDFYRSLMYPGTYDGQDFASVYPYTVLLSFGEYLDALPCLVMKAAVKVNYWTPKLEPVRATIDLVFHEIVHKSQTSADIFQEA